MEQLLFNFSEAHRYISYLIVFLVIFIEGELILVLAGVLSKNGFLDFFDLLIIAFAAAVLHDLFYWYIGTKLSAIKRKRLLFINLEKMKQRIAFIKEEAGIHIFISKFTWNLNRVTLIANGYLRLPLRKLLRYSIPACLTWTVLFISLGYFFAHETNILKQEIKTAILYLTGFLVLLFIIELLVRKFVKKKIIKNSRNENYNK